MKIMGISLGYNTSACVVSAEGGIEYAISEERITKEKNTKKFPIHAVIECIEHIRKTANQDRIPVAISSYEVINDRSMKYMENIRKRDIVEGDIYETMGNYIRTNNWSITPKLDFVRIDHHTAHRMAGVMMSGFVSDANAPLIAVTCDGFGDGISASVTDCGTGETLGRMSIANSLGLVYQFVTGALGFKEHQHEGKITGLSAFGTPKYVNRFRDRIFGYSSTLKDFILHYDDQRWPADAETHNANIHEFGRFLALKRHVYDLVHDLIVEGATREDIAASVQMFVEMMLVSWLKDLLRGYKQQFNIVLSGGLFANVKINREIYEQFAVKNLFVCPPMGDEGTCIGAASMLMILLHGLPSIYYGEFAKDKIFYGAAQRQHSFIELKEVYEKLLKDKGFLLLPITGTHAEDCIVRVLSKKKIVCISKGNIEFGPRALCNHSILYDASDKVTNVWLNQRLGRTEFMPFAPVLMDKFARDMFGNVLGLEKTLKYMTIALPVSDEFACNYRAAVHVDGTARPQILSEQDNPFMYSVLSKYYVMTGKKALINTSFNLHEYPIVADDVAAIDQFLRADLDLLVLENGIIIKEGVLEC